MPPPCCCSPQWVGAPCGSHGPYVFYRAFRFQRRGGGRARVLSLGDFFFVRCRAEEPACIAELQLLWEERTSRQLLSSAKLYFLPEDTPQGRTSDHGEVGTAAPAPAHLRAGRRDGTGRDGTGGGGGRGARWPGLRACGRWGGARLSRTARGERPGMGPCGAVRERPARGCARWYVRTPPVPRGACRRAGAGGTRAAQPRGDGSPLGARHRADPRPAIPGPRRTRSGAETSRGAVPAPRPRPRAERCGGAGPGGGNRAPRSPPRSPRPGARGRPLPAA